MAQHHNIRQLPALVQRPPAIVLNRRALDEVAQAREGRIWGARRAAAPGVEQEERARGGDELRVDEGVLVVDVVELGDEEGRGGEAARGERGAAVRGGVGCGRYVGAGCGWVEAAHSLSVTFCDGYVSLLLSVAGSFKERDDSTFVRPPLVQPSTVRAPV